MSAAPASSPFVGTGNSLRRLMLQVIVALLPGTLVYAWFFGPGVLVNIALAVAFALAFEAAILKLRARPVMPHWYPEADSSTRQISDCRCGISPPLLPLKT